METALLLTEEMREAYYTAKEYELSFAESEEVAKIIGEMGGLYQLVHMTYKTALDAYSSAIRAIDDFRYDMLVSPESEYQKSLTALREAKTELLAQKTYAASLDVNGEEYQTAQVTLQLREEDYDKAVAAYEKVGEEINRAIEKLIEKLREAENAMKELEDKIFDENIEAALKEKASQIESSLNAVKDNFFAEFEAAHADDIAAMQEALQAKKQEMKEAVLSAQK
jgi:chromosome segregation ATPase